VDFVSNSLVAGSHACLRRSLEKLFRLVIRSRQAPSPESTGYWLGCITSLYPVLISLHSSPARGVLMWLLSLHRCTWVGPMLISFGCVRLLLSPLSQSGVSLVLSPVHDEKKPNATTTGSVLAIISSACWGLRLRVVFVEARGQEFCH